MACQLPNDLIRQIYAYLPLRSFQTAASSTCSYRHRYFLRYATVYPKIQMCSFDTEEYEYLFFAAWFHNEVGYNSHLFYDVDRCLRKAVENRDYQLVTYFHKRVLSVSDSIDFESVINSNDIDIVRLLIPHGRIDEPDYPSLEIINVQVANYLLSILGPKDNLLFTIYKGIPASKLNQLVTDDLTNINILYGLLVSEDQIKIQRAKDTILQLLSATEITTKNAEAMLILLGLLDDPNVLINHLTQLSQCLTDAVVVIILVMVTAINCLKMFLPKISLYQENWDKMNGFLCTKYDTRLYEKMAACYYNKSIHLTVPSKRREILELMRPYFAYNPVFSVLAAYLGDEIVLQSSQPEAVMSILEDNGHWNLVEKFLAAGHTAKFYLDDAPFETLSRHRAASFLFPYNPDFNYSEWETLIILTIRGRIVIPADNGQRLLSTAPTPYLALLLRHHLSDNHKIVSNFITMPITMEAFVNAVRTGNIEYVRYALQSRLFKVSDRIKLPEYCGREMSSEMRVLLASLGIKYKKPRR